MAYTPTTNPAITAVASYHQDIFNQVVTGERSNDVMCAFVGSGTLTTLLTPAYTGTGAGTWTGGQAVFTTGTTNPSTVYAPSTTTVTYVPGFEIYAYFTAYFTAGVAGTFQRIGLTDKVNGFFVGMEGTTFSASAVTNSTITSVAQASFNVDTLTGAATSKFTRNGTPEAIVLTNQNVFRIRFGWLGSAPVIYEVLSPDGNWVIFHITRTPNTASAPSIQNPNLPMSIWTSSTGTNLTLGTSCLAAGTSSNATPKNVQPVVFLPTQDAKDSGRTYMSFYVDAIAGVTTEALVTMSINSGGTVTTGTSYTVPTGKTLRINSIQTTCKATSTVASTARIRVRSAATVTATSGILMATDIPAPTGTAAANTGSTTGYTVPEGIEIAAGNQIGISQIASATTLTISAIVTGYLY